MSLDSILHSIDNLLIDVSENVNRLLKTLTWFIPIFVVAFTILVFLLLVVAIVSLILQCKRNRQLKRTNQQGQIPPPLISSSNDYVKVETTSNY
ncbi:hypothetical protein M3Y98_00120300 [Aphelenchoides besseyi]|nr:hypothetical protein M3Y98_00120300 [Aphelenchoides besseyi]KAI6199501.1 hypothetical protein M3Y96_00633900 [Aphelenchoides besseyi]